MKSILILSYKEDYSINIIKGIYKKAYKLYVTGNIDFHRKLRLSTRHIFLNLPYDFEDTKNFDQINKDIIQIIEEYEIEVVLPSDFESLKLINVLYQDLSKIVKVMAVPDRDTINELDDKYNCCLFFKNNEILTPKTISYFINDKFDEQNIFDTFSCPFLIKPVISAGGVGIQKINDLKEFRSCFSTIRNQKDQASLIFQKLIDGVDYCFNGFAISGEIKAHTIFRYIEFDNNKSKGVFVEFIKNDDVFSISEKILKICNYSGPIVIDYIKDTKTGEYFCIEINPRFGNNTHYSLKDGIDFMEVGIQLLYNQRYFATPNYAGIICLSPKRLFTAPFRRLDFSAFYMIFKIGLPQLLEELYERVTYTLVRLKYLLKKIL